MARRPEQGVPAWFKGLLLVDGAAGRLMAAFASVRDELALAYVKPEQRAAVIRAAFRRSRDYTPGGGIFDQGLFSWEAALLARPEIPRAGRVLLASAGGGRELKALAGLGYDVFAFDPVEDFCISCRSLLAEGGRSRVVVGSLEDLAPLARDGSGALAALRGPYDLVWLGWSGFTHVTVPAEQKTVLESIRRIAPRAPVVLSYLMREPGPDARRRRLRRFLRRALPHLGGRHASPALEYLPHAGFAYRFTEEELPALFRSAGYSAALLESQPYPHALLTPD